MIRQRIIRRCTIENGGTLDFNSKHLWAATMEIEPLCEEDVGEFVKDIEESCNVIISFDGTHFDTRKTTITGKESNVRAASKQLAQKYAEKVKARWYDWRDKEGL